MGRTGTVAVNGTEIATRIDGAEDAPWLVLSNSLCSDMSMWDPQIDVLTRHFRVLRYDTRGHGASAVPAGPYSFADFTGDAIGLMDHFGIGQACFMGVSLGGMTALGLGLAHPGRFARLVVADARAVAPEDFRAGLEGRIKAVEEGGIGAIVEGMLESWLSPETIAARPEAADQVRAMVSGTDPAGCIATCRALQRLDYIDGLSGLALPVLYICGSDDTRTPPEAMREMAEATPDSAYVELDGARHLANLDHPEEFNAAAVAFLAG